VRTPQKSGIGVAFCWPKFSEAMLRELRLRFSRPDSSEIWNGFGISEQIGDAASKIDTESTLKSFLFVIRRGLI